MRSWSLQDLRRQFKSPTLLSADLRVLGVAVDSRNVRPGDLFFALEGAKQDGHDFIAAAASKGAVAAVVKNSYSNSDLQIPLLHVENPLLMLQEMAASALRLFKGKIGAITGSLGKTTTKGILATLLKEKYRVAASPGNSNSQIGLPLAVLNHTSGDEEILIFEMGITHANQLPRLIEIAPPDIAVVTTIAPVHIANFPSLEELALAKAAIFSHPKTSIGILSKDLPFFEPMSRIGTCQKISFSVTQEASFSLIEENSQLKITHCNQVHYLPPSNLPGAHNLHNLLAAVAAAKCFGMEWEEMQKGIPKLVLPEMRFEQVMKKGVLFINDSYNASEASIKAALQCLPQVSQGGKKIAVLGDIVDLGNYATACYQGIGEATLAHVDLLICLGKDCGMMVEAWKKAQRPVLWCHSLQEVVHELDRHMGVGDVVLLKGSNKHKLWEILNMVAT